MRGLCVVCRRRPVEHGAVCEPDRVRIADQLADLPAKVEALTSALMPSPGAPADRVATSKTHAPIPVRMDTLSLVGPGADQVTVTLHPLVRHYSTVRTVLVSRTAAGKTTTEERQIVEWHHQAVLRADGSPVLVGADGRPHDDQTGVLPPVEWLESWAAAWREHFGHAPQITDRPPRPDSDRKLRRPDFAVVLGMDTHRRDADPLAQEWTARFGEPVRNARVARTVRYLTTWLDQACDADVGIGDFAAELRTLHAELGRVLGETPDQQWLGRCPAVLTDRYEPADPGGPDAELRSPIARPCGAGLWQDPHASQVMCPRCHTTWGPRQVELLYLAADIRRTWPVDRRRRYTIDEIEQLPEVPCPTCARDVHIRWQDVTATLDTQRWWRPTGVACPYGCPEAERLI